MIPSYTDHECRVACARYKPNEVKDNGEVYKTRVPIYRRIRVNYQFSYNLQAELQFSCLEEVNPTLAFLQKVFRYPPGPLPRRGVFGDLHQKFVPIDGKSPPPSHISTLQFSMCPLMVEAIIRATFPTPGAELASLLHGGLLSPLWGSRS